MAHNLKVLVVDDEEELAEMLSESLKKSFKSSYVTSGKDALELVERGEVDIIVSDSQMPGMTGLELLERLKEAGIKVLFYLATGDLGVTEQIVKDKGGHGIFEKPFSPSAVIGKIMEDKEKIQ